MTLRPGGAPPLGAVAGLHITALLINLVFAILQCGLGAWHITGYALL